MKHEIEQLEKENKDLRSQLLKGSVELETLRKENEELKDMNHFLLVGGGEQRVIEHELRAQIEQLKQKDERSTLVIETTYNHLKVFLDEMEASYYVMKQFISKEICIQYIDAAKWAERFGRTSNSIKEAQQWLESKDTDDDKDEPSDHIFKSFTDIEVKPIG